MIYPRNNPDDVFIRISPGQQRKDALVYWELIRGLDRINQKIDEFLEKYNDRQHGTLEQS